MRSWRIRREHGGTRRGAISVVPRTGTSTWRCHETLGSVPRDTWNCGSRRSTFSTACSRGIQTSRLATRTSAGSPRRSRRASCSLRRSILSSVKPLEGVRILDVSRMVAGGVCGMLLADFGADVVKVEQPGTGDPLRQWTTEGEPFWWKVYGRNKRYITLNLKTEEGAALFRQLLPRFDVVMES